MLEKLFNDDSCQRLLAGPMGPHLGALSSKLAELGYCESRARKVVCTAAALGDWLAERGLTPAEAGRAELKAYIKAQKRLPSETWLGSRDHALLLALYNTGARSSEMTGATRGQVSFGSTALFQLHGKGRKERPVPLWPQTARVLHRWFQMVEGDDRTLAFPSIRGTALSADALDYLLQCAVKKASTTCPDLAAKRVTPHVMRHTTAMHLLQSGVDIAVVAPWLGHESIGTTHGYVEADLEAKQRALDKLTPASGKVSRFKAGDSLLQFLAKLQADGSRGHGPRLLPQPAYCAIHQSHPSPARVAQVKDVAAVPLQESPGLTLRVYSGFSGKSESIPRRMAIRSAGRSACC